MGTAGWLVTADVDELAAALRALLPDQSVREHLLIAVSRHREWCAVKRCALPAAFAVLVEAALDACGASVLPDAQARWRLLSETAEAVPNLERMVAIPEAARVLGVSRRTLERRVRDGVVRSRKIGGARRIAVSELERHAS